MHAREVVRLSGARGRPAGCLPRPCVPFFGVRPSTHSAARNSRFLSLSLSLFSHNIQPGRMQSAKSASRSSKVSVRLERISFACSLSHTVHCTHTLSFISGSGAAAHSLALRLPGDRRARGNTSELTNSINRKGEKPERRRASGAKHQLCVFATQGRRAVFVSTFYYVRCLPCPRRKRADACIVERRNPQNPRALPPTITLAPISRTHLSALDQISALCPTFSVKNEKLHSG